MLVLFLFFVFNLAEHYWQIGTDNLLFIPAHPSLGTNTYAALGFSMTGFSKTPWFPKTERGISEK